MRCPRPGLVTLAIKGRGSGWEESLLVNKFLQCRGIAQSVHDERIREMGYIAGAQNCEDGIIDEVGTAFTEPR